jgi:acetyl esterase/lipase
VHGSSAGANLAAAVTLKARDKGLPLPGACSLHTAAVDLTDSGDTFQTNILIDVVLQRPQGETMALYIGGHDPRDPYLSPVFADFGKGFPPTILVSGTRDVLLSPTVMMHRALRRAGLKAELHVFEAMPHGGFGETAPEDRELQGEIARFWHEHLGWR